MNITVLHNCATIIKSKNSALAIDVFSKGIYPFDGISPRDFSLALHGEGIFQDIIGVLYTHIHPDHYDKEFNRQFADKYKLPAFIPDHQLGAGGSFKIGDFLVKYHRISHSGREYKDVIHYVFLINAEGKNVYIAGDADFNSKEHLNFLRGVKVDAAFFNPFYLSAQIPIIRLISAKTAYIYHIPKEEDSEGIRHMAMETFKNFSKIEDNCRLIDSYPYTITL